MRDGDTLETLARQYGVSAQSIALENSLTEKNTLTSGSELSIPVAESAPTGNPRYQAADVSGAANASDALKLVEAARPGYTASDALLEAERQLANWQQNKPSDYVSTYDEQIEAILSSLQNRPAFSYDPTADPLYQNYRQQYMLDGQMAMLDTAANAAALSGGYANSYAVTAASQAYQQHLSDLGDVVPLLYDRAYDAWLAQGEELAQELDFYRQMEQNDYTRWRDGVDDYYEDLTYYYNLYDDMSDQEYRAYQDDLSAWEADRDYWYQRLLDEQQQANWKAEYDLDVQKAASSAARSSGGSSRSSASSSAESAPSSNYNTFLNGLKESVRIQVLSGRSKTSVYSSINNQINEFLSNDFITAAEAKQMRAVAQSYYQTQYDKRRA